MDNIMIGDIVLLLTTTQHPTLGLMPRYTLAIALRRKANSLWELGVTGFGRCDVPRDAFELYQPKSVIRFEMLQRRDEYIKQAGL